MKRQEGVIINKEIEVLDAIMGSGKTTAVLDWLNDNPSGKYIYVAPSLSEAEDRVPSYCERLEFIAPNIKDHDNKSEHLLDLLRSGANISCTQHLFSNMRNTHFEEVNKQGYTVFVDETIDLIQSYNGDLTPEDLSFLHRVGAISADYENFGKVNWLQEGDADFKYSKLRNKCRGGQIFATKRSENMLISHLPLELVTSAKRVVLITYLFEGSVMHTFLKAKDFQFKPYTDVTLAVTEGMVKLAAQKLIQFGSTRSVEEVFEYRQSNTWYTKDATKQELSKIANAIRSVYRLFPKAKERVLVTLPKNLILTPSKSYKGRSVKDRNVPLESVWLYSGSRGTNIYRDKDVVIYCYNRYPSLPVTSWMSDWDLGKVDDDRFAIAEMVQFIWRSCIRSMKLDEDGNILEGKTLHLYITNKRMDSLFRKWLFDV